MINIILPIILAFVLSAIIAAIAIPYIVYLCKKYRIYDLPNERKVHKRAIPRLGGLTFMPATTVGLVGAIVLWMQITNIHFEFYISAFVMIAGAMVVYILGFIDDLRGLGAKLKFVIMFVASSLLPFCNVTMDNLCGLFGVYELNPTVGYLITVFFIMIVVNAVNLIDGIDGLASGFSIIVLICYLFLFLMAKSYVFVFFCAALLGCVSVFFLFNMFGKEGKNKIFMGDAGSLFLGYVLAYLTIKYQLISSSDDNMHEAAILTAFSMFIVPVCDLVRVAICRFINKKPIFQADKRHIHHVLMTAGCSMHMALSIILALVIFFVAFNYAMYQLGVRMPFVLLCDVLIFALFHFVLYRITKRKRQLKHS